MNKFKLQVGTPVTFVPASACWTGTGTIVKRYESGRSGQVTYVVRVVSGTGAGKDWTCEPTDIISFDKIATI